MAQRFRQPDNRAKKESASTAGQDHRVPPGQIVTERFPVLHEGGLPEIRLEQWQFRLFGQVEAERVLSWEAFRGLPANSIRADVHCVTRWSKLDTTWEGVATRDVLRQVALLPSARYVLVHAAGGYSANLALDAFLAEDALFAWAYDGVPLSPQHGWPLRLVVPQRYFWKSVKWVTGVEFLAENRPGYWEERGYHMEGDPWSEERFGW